MLLAQCVASPGDLLATTWVEMAGNAVKSHFTCFDFQRMFHSSDVFCTLSCLFVRLGFRLLCTRLAVHYTTPEEFENGSFTLKSHQMFILSTLRRRNLKTQQSPVILDLCLRNWLEQGNLMMIATTFYRKVSFSKCFHTETESLRRQIPPVWRAFSGSYVFVAD